MVKRSQSKILTRIMFHRINVSTRLIYNDVKTLEEVGKTPVSTHQLILNSVGSDKVIGWSTPSHP